MENVTCTTRTPSLPSRKQNLVKESSFEAPKSPLFYVFVTVFSLDRAHTTIGFEFCMSNEPIKMLLELYVDHRSVGVST